MLSKIKSTKIAVIMGSKSDWLTMKFTTEILIELNVLFHVEIISAHRTPDKLFQFSETAVNNGYHVIIAGAGGAAHLPGMIASKTLIPVLGVPIHNQNNPLNGLDSLCSIVQMPRGIPVGTLAIGKNGAINAGLLAVQILAINDNILASRLNKWRQSETNKVLSISDPRK